MSYEGQPFASPGEVVDVIEHYGVKGMRWGVRKEQDTSSRDKVLKDIPMDTRVGVIDPITATIGAIYAAAILGTIFVGVRDALRFRKDSGKHIQEATAKIPWKKKPSLAKKMSVDQLHENVVKQINSEYPKAGTKMNCRRCTMAYEMRRRGNDVKATKSHFATGQDEAGIRTATLDYNKKKGESVWGQKIVAPGHEFTNRSPEQKSNDIFSALNKNPEGARGELGVGWQMGGGHSMAWEVVNGKAVIIDGQSSVIYRDAASFTKEAKHVHEAAITRTDNLKLDEHFLKRWMINVE